MPAVRSSAIAPTTLALSSFASRNGRRLLIVFVVMATALAMLVLVGFAGVPAASAAATAPAANQCNPPAYPTGAGFQVTCTITVDNTVSSAGVSTSTVTSTACLAAAGVVPPFGCTTTVNTSNQLVTSVNQCNGVAFGGGSNVACSVAVVNTVTTGTAAPGVTVNQCVGSGTGGGTQPTVACAPVATTTGATVTQCNGSGNGGGASMRVLCTVTGGVTTLPVTINQCNGSANGGGSTVICTTAFTNNFVTAPPTTTTTVPPAATTTTTAPPAAVTTTPPTTPAGTVAVAAPTKGGGVTGTTGTAAGAGGSTTVTGSLGVIPFGAPQTGLGGASRSSDGYLLLVGVLALVGAALASAFAVRRRRVLPHAGGTQSS